MVWVPPKVSREMEHEALAHRAEALAALVLSEELKEYNRELREIDRDLQVAWVDENTHVLGLTPGRFHLIRDNHPFPPALIPYQDEAGGFLPLSSHLFDFVRHADLWNDQVTRDRRRRTERAEQAQARAKERERADMAEEIDDRIKAAFDPGVSMTKAGPWSYRAHARKAA